MKLKANAESIEKVFRKPRTAALRAAKSTANLSLIPSLSTPFDGQKLQEVLKKANSDMVLLDANGLQADTLLYAEDRFFTLYKNAVNEAGNAQFFLLLSPSASQESTLYSTSGQMNTSYDLLLSQICAALRASAKGRISLLLPSVGTMQEIDTTRQAIRQAMRNLSAQGIPFDETVSLGIVLGTPASLLVSRKLIEAIDLVMIDTDFLAALSLNSTTVSQNFDHLLNENASAILRLAEIGVGNAHLLGRYVMLCGSMLCDPRFLPHFLAMGANGLAVSPEKLKSVKSLLRRIK